MKEPLYKAKMRNSNEWICGYCFKRNGYYTIKPTDKDGHSYGAERPVDEQTICEYSGLTDKNGVKIFDDDIVTFDGVHFLTVAFRDFMWGTLYNGVFKHRLEEEDSQQIMVVGNIYDNLELIKKE